MLIYFIKMIITIFPNQNDSIEIKPYMKCRTKALISMSNVESYRCESCGSVFSSQEELIQHENYAKYRRPGCCWQ
jgi:DNA-directed RNA polymerase subunit RPC12/RpoP